MDLKIYSLSEEELIQGCIRRDRVAQKNLFDAFSPKMYPLCIRYVKNPVDAEDVLVTSFTNILERIHQFRGEGSLEGWIKKVVINEAISFLRKKKHLYIMIELKEAESLSSYKEIEDHLVEEDLIKMIQELPPGYQAVFNLYAIDGYSHKEIAEQLNISENTSKSQLSRARVYLQKLLAERDISRNHIRHDITTG